MLEIYDPVGIEFLSNTITILAFFRARDQAYAQYIRFVSRFNISHLRHGK
jgi:hypothetical protein